MEVLKKSGELKPFFKALNKAPTRLLMLDYDGVLSPLQIDRRIAKPWPGVQEKLERLIKSELCKVVIISGRVADELADLLDWGDMPEIWGNHGWERLSPKQDLLQNPLPDEIGEGLHEARVRAKADWGDAVEHKYAGVVMHHRGMSAEKQIAMHGWVVKNWGPLESVEGLLLHPIDGGHEIRAEAHNKGRAVRTLLEENSPCLGAYLGDDHTDEDAFKSLKGKGLSVLVRPELRKTEAEVWIQPPKELLSFFDQWEVECRKSG